VLGAPDAARTDSDSIWGRIADRAARLDRAQDRRRPGDEGDRDR
jgi:hypothetical protein